MIFELAQGVRDAVAAMPRGHPRHQMLELLEEAIRRDLHFVAQHPTTLIECMWNTCWWHDCPEAAHFDEPQGGGPAAQSAGRMLSKFTGDWRTKKQDAQPSFPWLGGACPACLCMGL